MKCSFGGFVVFQFNSNNYLQQPGGLQPAPRTINYYDTYSFVSNGTLNYDGSQEQNGYTPQYTPPSGGRGAIGLLTGTRVYHLDNPSLYETTALYYDKYGRVVQTRATNHLNGYDLVYNALDFTGKPTKTLKNHNIAGQASISELYTYKYDKAQRMLTTTLSLNGGDSVKLVTNTYDDLGRLASKNIGGVDTTAYNYNVRSWTKDITGSRFSENLYYTSDPKNSNNAHYNGNIAAMQWKVADDNLSYNRAYSFTYDDLNRLTNANYYGLNNNGSVVSGTTDLYNESFGFDKMGNFNSLTRNENGTPINNLSFVYNGNQLNNVNNTIVPAPFIPYGSEAFKDSLSTGIEYNYDPNGSTTADINTGISTIQYNLLNLPDQIQFTEGHKNLYTYNAGGTKLETVSYTVNNIVNVPIGTISTLPGNPSDYTKLITDYVGNIIYENGSLKQIMLPEGYWQNGVFYYYLKDHLGDTRIVINSSGTIIEKSHYYPSGMRFADTSTSNSSALPFRYNGKEMETMNGLNQMDYGARRRYSGLPIWTGPDELREKYYSISPYAYCMNNPVKYVDPDGKDVHIAKADRAEILGYINSLSAGTFGINKNGNLYLKSSESSNGKSDYYRDRLVAAILDKDVINISKGQNYTDSKTQATLDVDKDAYGGVTQKHTPTKTDATGKIIEETKVADVIISGNKTESNLDTNGNTLRDGPAEILMHELVGHAIPWTVGSDTGNAIKNENKVREQLGTGQDQQRKANPKHVE